MAFSGPTAPPHRGLSWLQRSPGRLKRGCQNKPTPVTCRKAAGGGSGGCNEWGSAGWAWTGLGQGPGKGQRQWVSGGRGLGKGRWLKLRLAVGRAWDLAGVREVLSRVDWGSRPCQCHPYPLVPGVLTQSHRLTPEPLRRSPAKLMAGLPGPTPTSPAHQPGGLWRCQSCGPAPPRPFSRLLPSPLLLR